MVMERFATSHHMIRYSGLDVVRGIGISYHWLLTIQYPARLEPALASNLRKLVRCLIFERFKFDTSLSTLNTFLQKFVGLSISQYNGRQKRRLKDVDSDVENSPKRRKSYTIDLCLHNYMCSLLTYFMSS